MTALVKSGSFKFGNNDVVTIPAAFEKGTYVFRPWEVNLMWLVAEKGVSIEEAAKDVAKTFGIEEFKATKFLRSHKAKKFFLDRAQEVAICQGYTAASWLSQGIQNAKGDGTMNESQRDTWKTIGERIFPKAAQKENKESVKVTINIGAIKEAEARQRTIEVEAIPSGAE